MDFLITALKWAGILYGSGALLMFLWCLILCIQAKDFGANIAMAVQASVFWPRYLPEFIKAVTKR